MPAKNSEQLALPGRWNRPLQSRWRSQGVCTIRSMHTLSQLRSGQLQGIRRLDLSAGLSTFPREIFDLADTLEVLNLSGNALTTLPDDLPRLLRLRVIFCSGNRFTELPAILGQCAQLEMVGFKSCQIRSVPAAALPPRLRWLILTDNHIRTLPAEIGQCQQLQKLMLAGNQLQHLPPALAQCQALELLRISANPMADAADLPGWLLHLPRLSWLARAGTPHIDPLGRSHLLDRLGAATAPGRRRLRRDPPGPVAR